MNQPTNAAPSANPAEKMLDFKFSVQTINAIISALDEIPHKIARPIIDDIGVQARPQFENNSDAANGFTQAPSGPLANKVIQ
jgi:hypothetical protein